MNTVIETDALTLLSSLDPNSVGCIMTDPPFFISIGRSGGGEFSDPWAHVSSLQDAINEVTPVVREAVRVLRPGGALVVMGQGIAKTVWDTICRTEGLVWMTELAVLWNTGKPRNRNFGSLWGQVTWYLKPGARHSFNSNGLTSIYSNVIVCQKVPITERSHPAEKPVGLTNFLVSLLSNEEDLIVDPFCGSGSTLVSAAQCGRPYLGSDLNPEYVQIARCRAEQHELETPAPVYLWINGRLESV